MSFARPTLAELLERAVADIEAGLPGTDARLRRSVLNILARIHSGGMHGLYGYLDWLAEQLMVDTAGDAALSRHAAIWHVRRVPAAFAAGAVAVTGTSGAVLPAGAQIARGDGATYVVTADALIVDGAAAALVEALVAGAAGNADAGAQMSLVQPVPGVVSAVTVAAGGLTQGADSEPDEALRQRVLARIRQAPMGGAQADYVAWALEVPGVTRAWCYPLEDGPGTVSVRFVRDNDASIIPDGTEVAAVQAHIDAVRPVCAQVTVHAPVATPLDISIALTPNTAAVRAAVQAELVDLIRREGSPGGTLLLSHIREAVSVAAGETNSVLLAPTADVAHSAGQMPVLGTFTWS